MNYIQYNNPGEFLEKIKYFFEEKESVHGLMYGICLQLLKNPLKYGTQPLFGIIEDNFNIKIAALMTPPYKMQLCSPAGYSEQDITCLVSGLKANNWKVPGVLAEKDLADSFCMEWIKVHPCSYRYGMKQRIHELGVVQNIQTASGGFSHIKSEEIKTAFDWMHAFHVSALGQSAPEMTHNVIEEKINKRELFFWRDPFPVSVAGRVRPTPNGESISYVYTPPEYRKKGYATSLVAALSQMLLDEGKKFCGLYTDLANPISNSIYRKIGYVPVADVIDIFFE